MADTCDVIRCFAAGLCRQYEGLVVASIVCYPNRLIAADGKAYDDLVPALRRTCGDRRGGSLVDLLEELLEHIRSGRTAPTGAPHPRREFTAAIERRLGAAVAEQTARTNEPRREFEGRMAFGPADPRRPRVGLRCASPADLPRVRDARGPELWGGRRGCRPPLWWLASRLGPD